LTALTTDAMFSGQRFAILAMFSDGFPWLFHSLSQIPYGSAAVDFTPVLERNRLQNLGALMLSTAVL
jgi:hypothetical protein